MIGFLHKRPKVVAAKRDDKAGDSRRASEAKSAPTQPPPALDEELYEAGDICAPDLDRDDYTKDL
ncbi:MAG: hypothetical protein QM576_04245 [Rhodopseudomonas sp.]|uniref:hypothetical protein n=1 Tax=Rhodopseudomonas sp. TaxID=1078 RepID=UPI0039E28D3E